MQRLSRITRLAVAIAIAAMTVLVLPPHPTPAAEQTSASYAFSEGTGTTAADLTGNGNAATLTNGAAWTTAGRYGKAVALDGVDDAIVVADSNSLDLTAAFTVEAWIYSTAAVPAGTIIRKEGATGASYALGLTADGKPYVELTTASGSQTFTGDAQIVLPNQWVHLAATYNGSAVRVMVNGVKHWSWDFSGGALVTSTGALNIGGSTGHGFFAGRIDEARVYDYMLGEWDVSQNLITPFDAAEPFGVGLHTPVNGARGVVTTPVTVRFTRQINPSTLTSSTFQLRQSGIVVGATVAWNEVTRTATLTPSSPLTLLTEYTATVTGGASGVRDTANTPLAADVTWSFYNYGDPLRLAFGFSEGTGTSVADTSGNANVGGLMGGTAWTDQGQNENALTFDGVDDAVRVSDSESQRLTTAFTLEAWVRPTAAPALANVIYKQDFDSDNDPPYTLALENGKPFARARTSGHYSLVAPSALPLNQWSHLATTYDGTNLKLFVNASQVATATASGTLLPSIRPLWIGSRQNGGRFQGRIDDVRVYSRALTATELAADRDASVESTSAPTVVSTSPASGAVGVAVGANVSATFNTALASASVSSSTFELRNASGALVAGSVSYDSATRTATLNPTSDLSPNVVYTATLKGGGGGSRITNTIGIPMATDYSWSFTTTSGDATPPTISVVQPSAGQFVKTTTPTIGVDYSDNVGVDTATLEVLINGVDRTALFTKTSSSATATIPADPPLPQGNVTVSARIRDGAGNESAPATSTFTVDSIAPQIVMLQPPDNHYTNLTSLAVSGGIVDESPATVRVAGIDATVTASSFTASVPIGAGPTVTLDVVATDAAGNISPTTTLTVRVDRLLPSVALTSPVAGSWHRGPSIAVTGTVTDETAVASVLVNDLPADLDLVNHTFSITIGATGHPLPIEAKAYDSAGNVALTSITVNVDTVAPVLAVTEPTANTVTNANAVHVAGTVSDNLASPTVRVNGNQVTVQNGAFATDVPLPAEESVTLTITAQDLAGNSSQVQVPIVVDRTAPTLTITTPSADGDIVGNSPVLVQGTVADASGVVVTVNGTVAQRNGDVWDVSFASLADGPQTFTATAVDAAGNAAQPVTRSALLDRTNPSVTLNPSQLLTRENSVEVSGTITDLTPRTLTINGVTVPFSQTAPHTFTQTVPLANEGDNHVVAQATDATGRTGEVDAHVTRDSIAPTIELTAPDRITRRLPGEAIAVAADSQALDRVIFALDGQVLATLAAPPFTTTIAVPAGAQPGTVLPLTVTAFDAAQNSTAASHNVRVTDDGAVVGQVLDDATGWPIKEATVTYGSGSQPSPVTTTDRGQYSFPSSDGAARITAAKAGMTSVARDVSLAIDTGTVVLDARLTKLADVVSVEAAGREIAIDPTTTLVVPQGAAVGSVAVRATALSGQGLPFVLPLGWSPVRAVDVRGTLALQSAATLRASAVPAALCAVASPDCVFLVQYTTAGWRVVASGLAPSAEGVLNALLPVGVDAAFALVVADAGVPVPAAGEHLTGVEVQAIPVTATSTGVVEPPIVSPDGGGAVGTLSVQSPTPLPSGTVVQAAITETFNLANGSVASEEERTQDLVLYRSGTDLAAQFPIKPVRRFDVGELASGTVHLDILAGRETARGVTGGSEPVTLTSAGTTLSVVRDALTGDTAMTFRAAVLSSFLPTTPQLAPLSEFTIDLGGRVLNVSADLGVPLATLTAQGFNPATDTLLVARVERVSGLPRLVVVARAVVVGDQVVSNGQGLRGITRGGRYVLYRSTQPIGFVSGNLLGASGNRVVVETRVANNAGPFIDVADTGTYTVASHAGAVTVTARVPDTSLFRQESAVVTGNETATLDLALQGTVTEATVTPDNLAKAVSTGVQIDLSSPTPISPEAVGAATFTLADLGPAANPSTNGTPVTVTTVLSGSRRTIAIIPASRLLADHAYRFSVSGLSDIFGSQVSVPSSTFSTSAEAAPTYDISNFSVGFPNDNGFVTLTAPPNTVEQGSTVLVINATTGHVTTFVPAINGSLDYDVLAQLTDQLQITITDPRGNVSTIASGTFRRSDGAMAVNAAGGVITGDGGVEMRIPAGAVPAGKIAVFKMQAVPEAQLPNEARPNFADPAQGITSGFAGAMKIEVPAGYTPEPFAREVDLAFPVPPDAPEGATFVVVRRRVMPSGLVAYESLDYAEIEGSGTSAKLVTASYPLPGYIMPGAFDYTFAYWLFDQLMPGQPLGGVVTGKVLRVVWNPGAAQPTYEPVVGAKVSGLDEGGTPLIDASQNANSAPSFAVSQGDGTFTLFDKRYTGGRVEISAQAGASLQKAWAYEANPLDMKSTGVRFARNIATVNITFGAERPPVPPPAIGIQAFRTLENGAREEIGGVARTGESLIFAFNASNTTVQSVEINGSVFGVTTTPPAGAPIAGTAFLADYVPAQSGLYRLEAVAPSDVPGQPIRISYTFRAAPEGGPAVTLQSESPRVIEARTTPKADSTGVAVSVLPQVTFSEPVKQLPGNIVLRDASGATVEARLLGALVNGTAADITSPDQVVTAVTLQPLAALKYDTRYTLSLTAGIVDLDDGSGGQANKALEAYTTSFTTFAPADLGHTDETFTSGGIAIAGDRAYVAQNQGKQTMLRVFDVSDPVQPIELRGPDNPGSMHVHRPPPVAIIGNPVDLAVEDGSTLTGGRVLAVATNPSTIPFFPANVRIYDVSDDNQFHWLGAVTLGTSPADGMIKRMRLQGTMLYTLTQGLGKGVDVIDLTRARESFDAAVAGGEGTQAYFEMLRKLGLEGQSFGREAIVQSVHLPTAPTGPMSQMNDLQILSMVVDGTPRTIVVVAGRTIVTQGTPKTLAVVDPTTDQPLYFGSIHTATTEVTQLALAIGAATIDNTPLALVSGLPPAGGAGAHRFIVVNLTDPRQPVAEGYVDLPGSAYSVQDIVVRGTTAYVGTDAGTYLVELSDVAHPAFVGTIAGVGGRLAFTDDKLLFGTVRAPVSQQHALGGVRSAALGGPLLIIPNIPPQLTRFVAAGSVPGLGGVQDEEDYEELVRRLSVAPQIIGGAGISGILRIFQGNVEIGQRPLAFAGAIGSAVLERGTRLKPGGNVSMIAEADTPDGRLTSQRRGVAFGPVGILLDNNNDRVITDADQNGPADQHWLFWSPERSPGILEPILPTNGVTSHDLEDFATVRLRATVPVRNARLRLSGVNAALNRETRWTVGIKRRSPSPLDYLLSETAHKQQLADLNRTCYTVHDVTAPCGWTGFGSDAALPSSITNLIDRAWFLDFLPAGTIDLLFRCDQCSQDTSRRLVIEAWDEAHREWAEVAGHSVDIRPIRALMTIYSVRRSGTFSPKPDATRLPNSSAIPDDARTLTVLVHGFNVDEDSATRDFFPRYLRRLYWSGHPVLRGQRGAPHVVGFSWPGNQSAAFVAPFDPLGLRGTVYFPEDEYHAFQTGKVLADLIVAEGRDKNRDVDVIAHSLGNLVVNSALTFLQSGDIDKFVMNEAALPAEAFNSTYTPDAAFTDEAQEWGYPGDDKWTSEWALMRTTPVDPSCPLDTPGCRSQFDVWRGSVGLGLSDDELRKAYTERWTLQRPIDWTPYTLPARPIARGGPWRGLFEGNLAKTTVVNTFSRRDSILSFGWRVMQNSQKPNVGVMGWEDDDGFTQFWGTLPESGPEAYDLWGGPSPERVRLVRQWAELAHWFQSLSIAAGSAESFKLPDPPAGADARVGFEDFSNEGGSPNPVTTHSYLTNKPLWEVARPWAQIFKRFER